jgi:hypothetical protein
LENLEISNVLEKQDNPSIKFGENIYPILTSNALQEYDTPHFVTQLITEKVSSNLFDKHKTLTILNPGQGFIPLASVYSCSRDKITLASRDLLQLKMSETNLKLNAINYFETINSDFPQNKGDLLIWSIKDEDDKVILEKLNVFRKNFKNILLGGRLPVVKRVFSRNNMKIKDYVQKNGYIAVKI